ncbi:MAG: glycosyltransferase [Omnitrophica bacterium]|nr:glycosyltransferase [Candidatus Omnitrophota bacterium]
MFKEKLTVVIPTKDRPKEILRLLENISLQEVKPSQIIIVDGGKNTVQGALKNFPDLKIDYARQEIASLTAQRNAGVRRVMDEATLVGFFDDDIILKQGSLGNMMKFWETASADTGGAAFNILDRLHEKRYKRYFFQKLFLVNAEEPSAILPSGFQSRFSTQDKTSPVGWLPGCAMVWRKEVFGQFTFDERFEGYARYEEVDFSYRVGKNYKMFIVADAKIEHLAPPEDIELSKKLGKMQIANRLYFAKKNKGLSVSLCMWACLWLFINNVRRSLFTRDRIRYARKARGNIDGFLAFMRGR